MAWQLQTARFRSRKTQRCRRRGWRRIPQKFWIVNPIGDERTLRSTTTNQVARLLCICDLAWSHQDLEPAGVAGNRELSSPGAPAWGVKSFEDNVYCPLVSNMERLHSLSLNHAYHVGCCFDQGCGIVRSRIFCPTREVRLNHIYIAFFSLGIPVEMLHFLSKDGGCVILREIDFLLKICWSIPCLHPSWKVHSFETSYLNRIPAVHHDFQWLLLVTKRLMWRSRSRKFGKGRTFYRDPVLTSTRPRKSHDWTCGVTRSLSRGGEWGPASQHSERVEKRCCSSTRMTGKHAEKRKELI